jgi:SSS family solute:Na+ symporter
MLIINLNYWGCNQYITQRALGADLKKTRKKYYLLLFEITNANNCCFTWNSSHYQQHFGAEMLQDGSKPDRAYPVLLNLLPVGLKDFLCTLPLQLLLFGWKSE